MEKFTGGTPGRLIGPIFKKYEKVNAVGDCARHCMNFPETKCLSINYDFGTGGHCELVEAIEGHDFMVSKVGNSVTWYLLVTNTEKYKSTDCMIIMALL